MAAAAPLRPQGRSADALDTTTAAERAAAAATPRSSATALGETLAGLGAPTEPGFWLRTGLVDRARPGRVEAASGAGVAVELRPSGNAPGSGSQISLAAIRALGVPLNQLVALRVFTTD
ncbi:MAG: D-galactarate dehydratase [Pararhodobacter sp.]